MTSETVGNYRIVRKLGEGGMGAVYQGVDLMLERPVAIKMLRAEIARQPELIERFRVEAVTLAKLNHPRIATLFSLFREREEYYMVMEFVDGRTLEALLAEWGRLAPEFALEILRQTLDGMAHAHTSGVLHRDIKPANIMVTGEGGVKVTDFGIARILGSSRMTREGRIVGTLEYMAPERIRGEEADIRSDLYSAGVVLFEMLSGRLPFVSDTDYGLMQGHLQQAPPRLAEVGIAVSPDVEAVLVRALAKEARQRFNSAEEFRDALAALAPRDAVCQAPAAQLKPTRLAGVAAPLPETRPAPMPAAAPAATARRRPVKRLAAAAAVLVVTLGVAAMLRSRNADSGTPAQTAANPIPGELPEAEPAPVPPTSGGGAVLPPGLMPPATPSAIAAGAPQGPTPGKSLEEVLGRTPGSSSTARNEAAPTSIMQVRKLHIEEMNNRLNEYLADEIKEQLPRISLVDEDEADAVLTGKGARRSGSAFTAGFRDEFTATVSIAARGGRVLWTSQAGDRMVVVAVVKHGGPRKVAERLVNDLKKTLGRK
jgi:eukaryotic-like serine/threonine-protein kinase